MVKDTIARNGLLVVKRSNPLQPFSELIIVPRGVLDGLVTALHIRLDPPIKTSDDTGCKAPFLCIRPN